jgi:hypothetical protein
VADGAARRSIRSARLEPVEHTPVAPHRLVVEIETDTAFEAGRYRHGVKFLRIRAKLQPEDVSILV